MRLLVVVGLVVALSGCIGVQSDDAGLVGDAFGSNSVDAGGSSSIDFHWEGSSPVDVFVCAPLAGCPGFEATSTEWSKVLPGGENVSALHLELSWTPTNDFVGPMVFLLNVLNSNGGFSSQLVRLASEESPIIMHVEDIAIAESQSLQIQAWPEARNPGQPVALFIDPWEQPYTVHGFLTTEEPQSVQDDDQANGTLSQ